MTPVRPSFNTPSFGSVFLLLLFLSAFLPLSFLPLSSSSSVRLFTARTHTHTHTTHLYLAHLVIFMFSSLPHPFSVFTSPILLPSTDAPPYGRWANGLAGPLRPVGCVVWLSPGALQLAGSMSSHCRHLWVTYIPIPKNWSVYVDGHKWAMSMYDNDNVLAKPRCIYKVWQLNWRTGHLWACLSDILSVTSRQVKINLALTQEVYSVSQTGRLTPAT